MQTSLNKNSGLFLDSKSKFIKHLQTIFQKTSKNIGLLRQLQIFLFRCPLIAIYKSIKLGQRWYYTWWNFQYDISTKMESIQCNADLLIASAKRASSRQKLYEELGLETLQQRSWYRKLCCIYKIHKSRSPKYLYSIIPIDNVSNRTMQSNKILVSSF